jgi:hypothetical protein
MQSPAHNGNGAGKAQAESGITLHMGKPGSGEDLDSDFERF